VTATVRDRGIGHGGTVVAFTVSGANPGATGTGTCFPDDCVTLANGEVTFTYTGTNPGLDIISATISNATGLSSTVTATKTWTAVPGGGGGGGGDDDDDDDDDGDGGSRRRGRITIIEQTRTGGTVVAMQAVPGVTFGFHTKNLKQTTFRLADDATRRFKDLRAGTYTVAQDKKDGWRLDKIVCQDPTKNTKVVLDTRRAVIKLKAGEDVTCTFTNTKKRTAGPMSAMPMR
jgi:hypothetical protein